MLVEPGRDLKLLVVALWLAARAELASKRKLPITKLGPLFSALPADFRLTLADVGSVGGLHPRWNKLHKHLVTMNFDPLDERGDTQQQNVSASLLGAVEARSILRIARRRSMSSTLEPNRSFFAPFWSKPEDVEIVDIVEGAMTTLDRLVAMRSMWPDALKIDVQGGEADVLAGAGSVLQRSVLFAEIECSFAERYVGQQTFDQIVAKMRDQGFALIDLRRLKRYRYRNSFGIENPSLGRGARAGRLAFCDAIFMLEPEQLRGRIESQGESGGELGAKAIVLALVYGKADLAAALFDQVRESLPEGFRLALEAFLKPLRRDGGRVQRLHHLLDRWSQRV